MCTSAGAKWMRLQSKLCPSYGSITSRLLLRSNKPAIALANDGLRWITIPTAAPRSFGRCLTNVIIAWKPPAEAPITITSRRRGMSFLRRADEGRPVSHDDRAQRRGLAQSLLRPALEVAGQPHNGFAGTFGKASVKHGNFFEQLDDAPKLALQLF